MFHLSMVLHVFGAHRTVDYEWRDRALMFNVVNVNRG